MSWHTALPLPVFICPQFQQTRYKLFSVAGRWACYRCHGLTHASRHKYRSIPKWHRLMRANGMSLRDAAKAHDLTAAEVRRILDEEAMRSFAGAELRRQWLLEARRLRELR